MWPALWFYIKGALYGLGSVVMLYVTLLYLIPRTNLGRLIYFLVYSDSHASFYSVDCLTNSSSCFLPEGLLQDAPTRNYSDALLLIFLVNGVHQLYAIHTLVFDVGQDETERAFLRVTPECFGPVRLRHDLMASFFKNSHDVTLHRWVVFDQKYSHLGPLSARSIGIWQGGFSLGTGSGFRLHIARWILRFWDTVFVFQGANFTTSSHSHQLPK